MSLEQKIMTELKAAMLSKNEVAVRSLRSIKAKIIEAKTSSGAAGEVSEEEEIRILQRMVKQRKDSVDIFRQQNREDLASKISSFSILILVVAVIVALTFAQMSCPTVGSN